MPVIALTHELGTLGGEIATGLAERLGLEVIHNTLVEHDIAERTGKPDSEVHRIFEGELVPLLDRLKSDRRRIARVTALEILELAARQRAHPGWAPPIFSDRSPMSCACGCVRQCPTASGS